jgi:DHA1 family inner membrane transport protein
MLALCFSAFVCFGVVLVLVGANQAEIAADLGLDLADSGLLVSAIALGVGIGVVAAGPVFDRSSRRPLFVGATLLAAAALISVDSTVDYQGLLVRMVLVGLGIGAYDTFINALIVERFREFAARPMTIVHAGATVGATLGPVMMGFAASRLHWTASFQWIGAAHLALAAAAFFVPFPDPPPRRSDASAGPSTRDIAFAPTLLPFAAIAFAYVGVEAAMTIFAIPYASDALALPAEIGRSAISAFWFGLLAGRLASALSARLLRPPLFVVAGIAGALAIAIGIGTATPRLMLLFAVVGATWGCVYPLMISLAGRQFPNAPGTAAGLAAGAGAIGGFVVPWATGAIGDQWGIAVAVASLALWSIAIAAGGIAAARQRPPPIEKIL